MKRLIHLMVLVIVISISAGPVAASFPGSEGIALLCGSGNVSNNTTNCSGNTMISSDNTGGAHDVNLTITGNTSAEPDPAAFGGLVLGIVLSLIYR